MQANSRSFAKLDEFSNLLSVSVDFSSFAFFLVVFVKQTC